MPAARSSLPSDRGSLSSSSTNRDIEGFAVLLIREPVFTVRVCGSRRLLPLGVGQRGRREQACLAGHPREHVDRQHARLEPRVTVDRRTPSAALPAAPLLHGPDLPQMNSLVVLRQVLGGCGYRI
jgi:hypothetical protein